MCVLGWTASVLSTSLDSVMCRVGPWVHVSNRVGFGHESGWTASTLFEPYRFSTPFPFASTLTRKRFSNPTRFILKDETPAHKKIPFGIFYLCAGLDSNQRRPKPTDLQSVVIDHSTTDATQGLTLVWVVYMVSLDFSIR